MLILLLHLLQEASTDCKILSLKLTFGKLGRRGDALDKHGIIYRINNLVKNEWFPQRSLPFVIYLQRI
jgi:hypothetical protein